MKRNCLVLKTNRDTDEMRNRITVFWNNDAASFESKAKANTCLLLLERPSLFTFSRANRPLNDPIIMHFCCGSRPVLFLGKRTDTLEHFVVVVVVLVLGGKERGEWTHLLTGCSQPQVYLHSSEGHRQKDRQLQLLKPRPG